MGSTLEHGIYLPSEGEKNCYQGLAGNWNKVDGALGDVAELKQSIESKFTKEIVTELPTEDINPYCIYMILKTDPETDNIYDEWVYINNNWEYLGNTKVDMTQYYTKQEVNQLPAVASGVTSTKVGNYDTHLADSNIHVTTADKNKWNNQTYVFRYSSTALTASSTNSNTLLDNTDNLKVGDKVIDSSGVLFSITAIDTQNSTFTIGTALIDIALDANVMHLSGNETVDGQKTFSDIATLNSYLYFTNSSVTKGTIPQTTVAPYRIYFGSGVNYGASLFNIDTSVSNTGVQSFTFRSAENVVSGDDARFALIYDPNRTQPRYLTAKCDIEPNADNAYECGSSTNIWKNLYGYHGYFCGQQKGDEFSSNARTDLTLLANRDTLGKSGAYISRFRQNKAQGSMASGDFQILSIDFLENEVRTNGVLQIQGTGWADDAPTKVNITSSSSNYTFGSSSKPCKINGLNPSSLGMPDLSNGIDISSYLTNAGTATPSEYTPLVDGYICIKISAESPPFIRMYNDYGFDNTGYTERNEGGSMSDGTYSRFASLVFPANKNVKVYIIIMPSTAGIISAKFFPCLGNV